jgi:hypothetical protein
MYDEEENPTARGMEAPGAGFILNSHGRCYRVVISFSKSECDVTDVVS